MHKYSSVSSLASDITWLLLLAFPFLQIGTSQFLPQAKRKMQFLSRLQLVHEILAELAGRPREHSVGLGDQLAEGRMGLKSEAETRLYELDDSHLP